MAKGGLEARADIVGQMDTALKVLDPSEFIGSRQSVPVSAFVEQQEGETFYGAPIDEVGPGGIVSRTTHLLSSMFTPIALGQAGINIAAQNMDILEPFLAIGEEKLDAAGHIVQALGLNLRAEGIDEAVHRMHPDFDTYSEENQGRVRNKLIFDVYGPRTRRDRERFQEKMWEVFPWTDTPQARARFKQSQNRIDQQRKRMESESEPGQVNGNGELPGFLSDIIENFPLPVGR